MTVETSMGVAMAPGRRGIRPLQPERKELVQVKMTSVEKAQTLARARQHGYETVSGFVRDAALGQLRPVA